MVEEHDSNDVSAAAADDDVDYDDDDDDDDDQCVITGEAIDVFETPPSALVSLPLKNGMIRLWCTSLHCQVDAHTCNEMRKPIESWRLNKREKRQI